MNGYKKIVIMAILMLITSITVESTNPFMKTSPSAFEYIHVHFCRFTHYFIYLITSFYLLFFNGIGTKFDMFVYLSIVLGVVMGWYIFDCCWLSYTELLFYNINLEKVKTTVHPCFYSIFNEYDKYLMILSGILYVITVSVILYYLKSVKLIYKILYFIIFMFFFIDGSLKGRVKTLYYSTKNKQLLFLKKSYHKYVECFIN
jgi:hypothetical protein